MKLVVIKLLPTVLLPPAAVIGTIDSEIVLIINYLHELSSLSEPQSFLDNHKQKQVNDNRQLEGMIWT